MRILVVEDDSAIQAMVYDMLTDDGHQVFVTRGDEPIAPLVRKCAPNLIILDLRLVGTTGEHVLMTLWQQPDLRGIPVILSSAWHTRMAEVQREAKKRGQKVWMLPKPYGYNDLLKCINMVKKGR